MWWFTKYFVKNGRVWIITQLFKVMWLFTKLWVYYNFSYHCEATDIYIYTVSIAKQPVFTSIQFPIAKQPVFTSIQFPTLNWHITLKDRSRPAGPRAMPIQFRPYRAHPLDNTVVFYFILFFFEKMSNLHIWSFV